MARKRPARPLTAGRPRPRRTIAASTGVGALAAGIIGYGVYADWRGNQPWTEKLAALSGVTDYAAQKPAWLTSQHKAGSLTYEVTPSVGGDHNGTWQNCSGTVYDAPIPAEHATHSHEHGAVWITYRTGLDAVLARDPDTLVRDLATSMKRGQQGDIAALEQIKADLPESR